MLKNEQSFFAGKNYLWLMSHNQLRSEKNCLNCGHKVDDRFCGVCGQENIQPRQTFLHLVSHVFEDITHYEGKFWSSLRLLFFKPGYLSRLFLEGKRTTYFPPVRLYIFASFITFFLPGLFPSAPEAEEPAPFTITTVDSTSRYQQADSALPKTFGDSAAVKKNRSMDEQTSREQKTDSADTNKTFGYTSKDGISFPTDFNTMAEVDSAKLARKETEDPMEWMEYLYEKRAVTFKESKYPREEQLRIFYEAIKHNFPKALFIYMPLFAFVLRLFHKRKNWIYFDHAIFTLHYFSFMLLAFLLIGILGEVATWVTYISAGSSGPGNTFGGILYVAGLLSFPYYLFKAHSRMYGETKGISFLKTSGILILNFILFIAIFAALILFTLFTMH
jgi:hypothetical protein